MSNIDRFDLLADSYVRKSENGYYVSYENYSELEQQKAELIASLAIALDDNKRKLYKDCLLKTLNKLKENQ